MPIKGPKIDASGAVYTEKSSPDRRAYTPKTLTLSSEDGTPQPDPKPGLNLKKTRADFRDEEFARLIGQHGKYTVWRKALICPCQARNTGQTDFACTTCDGSGFYYIDPIEVQAVVLMSDKSMNLYEKAGAWMSGQAQITVAAEHRLGHRDSIELRDSVMIFDELISKDNRRGIRSKLPAGVDSCRYRAANVVHAVFENAYHQFVPILSGTHFDLTSDGWLQWTAAGNALVPTAAPISIRYEFRPVYIVETFPHAWRDDVSGRRSTINKAIALPIHAIARLDYLIDVNRPLPSTWEV